jgi:2-oxo-4-hydroxy-4-carboxy-5-ureidoimidazoline decarboxylase
MININRINNLSDDEIKKELSLCCGSTKWVEQMIKRRPFQSEDELLDTAEKIWFNLSKEDWLEAFSHHPKIGDINSLKEKFANTKQWAEGEQSGVKTASSDILIELAEGNKLYEEKFGYIFIVCATGKSASEMLSILKERLNNDPSTEIKISAEEQNKITKIRLQKL